MGLTPKQKGKKQLLRDKKLNVGLKAPNISCDVKLSSQKSYDAKLSSQKS